MQASARRQMMIFQTEGRSSHYSKSTSSNNIEHHFSLCPSGASL
ncbi:MAG: hypothetical protein ACI93H_001772, partial [Psychromonas sp.]